MKPYLTNHLSNRELAPSSAAHPPLGETPPPATDWLMLCRPGSSSSVCTDIEKEKTSPLTAMSTSCWRGRESCSPTWPRLRVWTSTFLVSLGRGVRNRMRMMFGSGRPRGWIGSLSDGCCLLRSGLRVKTLSCAFNVAVGFVGRDSDVRSSSKAPLAWLHHVWDRCRYETLQSHVALVQGYSCSYPDGRSTCRGHCLRRPWDAE